MLVFEVGLKRLGDNVGFLDFSVFQAPLNPGTVQFIDQGRGEVEGDHLALFWCPLPPGLLDIWCLRRLPWWSGALLFLEKDVRALAFNIWMLSSCRHGYAISCANFR
jgi:hypothetical protein